MGIQVGVIVSGVPRRLKVGTDVIQGNLVVRMMWAEKWAHYWNLKRMVMEDVDPHRCARRHHRGIQHRVKVPMPNWKLNEDHHRA